MADIVEVFPLADYVAELDPADPNGELHKELKADPIAVPKGAKEIKLVVYRDEFPPETQTNGKLQLVMKGRIELSLDSGVTWSPRPNGEKSWPWGVFPIGFTTCGGEVKGPDGIPMHTTINALVQAPESDQRMLRVTFVPLTDVRTKVDCIV